MTSPPLLIVLGATASGKTKLATRLASLLDGEIISADSRQVFQDMNIGTGKDLDDYIVDGNAVPHHLINIKHAGETYNVNEFKDDFYNAFISITSRNKLAILCGGTGMYIHSLLQFHPLTAVPPNPELRSSLYSLTKDQLVRKLLNYPEHLRNNVDYSSHKRLIRALEIAAYLSENTLATKVVPSFKPVVVGLKHSLEERRNRILGRLDDRLANGLVEEVQMLMSKGVTKEMLTFYGLEYKLVSRHIEGELNFVELKEKLGVAICQFAKRQMTFFRKMEKDGVKINWLDASMDLEKMANTVINLLSAQTESN